MKFMTGDLPEVVEQEIDGEPVPVEVKLPVTINGRIFPSEDVDVWTFKACKGQTICCEVYAARLGSPLDSRLEVRDPGGQPIATTHYNGRHSGRPLPSPYQKIRWLSPRYRPACRNCSRRY